MGYTIELSKHVDVGSQRSHCGKRHIQIWNGAKQGKKVPYESALQLEIAA